MGKRVQNQQVTLGEAEYAANTREFAQACARCRTFLSSFYTQNYDFSQFEQDWDDVSSLELYFHEEIEPITEHEVTDEAVVVTNEPPKKMQRLDERLVLTRDNYCVETSDLLNPHTEELLQKLLDDENTLSDSYARVAEFCDARMEELFAGSLRQKFHALVLAHEVKEIFKYDGLRDHHLLDVEKNITQILDSDDEPVRHGVLVSSFRAAKKALSDANGSAEKIRGKLAEELKTEILETTRSHVLKLSEMPSLDFYVMLHSYD